MIGPTGRLLGRAASFLPVLRPRSYLHIAAIVGIIALFLVPTGITASVATWGNSGPSTALVAPSPSALPAVAPHAAAATGAIAGANPSLNSPINAATIAATSQGRVAKSSSSDLTSSTPNSQSPPNPGSYVLPPLGWFTGTVANASDTSDVLSGVGVQAFALASSNQCPVTTCAPTHTNTTGSFNVTCEAGSDYITFLVNLFAENLTYSTCDYGQTVSVGTVLLVPDGFVTGFVKDDVNGTPGIGGVTVEGCARGCAIIAQPTTTTASSTGAFTVPVPPDVASEVQFVPPGAAPIFQSNFTWVTALSGQTVDIGTVFLEPNSLVKATLYDAITDTPISIGDAALTVCSLTLNVCGPQGTTMMSGSTVEALGPPGYDYAEVDVVSASQKQYVVNDTPIGLVPGTTHGHPFCVPNNCRIYVMPMGEVSADVAISGNYTHQYGSGSLGLFYISVSTLNGYKTSVPTLNPSTYTINMTETTTINGQCASPTALVYSWAFPLRNKVVVEPDTTGNCGFGPQWPIPGDFPVWSNTTVANATPDEVTGIGWLNLTGGVYLDGNVFVQGTTSAPANGFSVTVESRIDGSVASYPYYSDQSPNECPAHSGNFCAPAPPGPDQITVKATGYPQNVTWGAVPWNVCCVNLNLPHSTPHVGPVPLANITDPNASSINLTVGPELEGNVTLAGSSLPVSYAAVTVCPAGSQETATCQDGISNLTGGYDITDIPLGWDYVSATGSGDQPNGEWINVGPGLVYASPLPLERLASLSGHVLSTGGSPIIDATITYCNVASSGSSNDCATQLGVGVTQSDGNYLGLVEGGWLPWSTYEVEAAAPGYVSDWTFVNATVNTSTVVPNLILASVGVGGGVDRAAGALASAPLIATGNTWVTGRVVDNATGRGVQAQSLTACSVANTGTCYLFTDGTNTGGFFNQSVPAGVYNLSVVASGYLDALVPLAATTTPNFDAGVIYLSSLNWIEGNVTMQPWESIVVSLSSTHNVTAFLAPIVKVQVCTASFQCTPSEVVGTGGDFMVQSYVGSYLQVEAIPTFTSGTITAQGGWEENISLVNITVGQTSLPPNEWPSCPLFAAISGTLWTNESWNPVTQSYTDPARWAGVLVQTEGSFNAAVTETASAGGQYIVLLDGGNKPGNTNIQAGGTNLDMWYTTTVVINATLGPHQNMSWGEPGIGLVEFGWADTTVVDSTTGVPLPGVGMSATYNDPLTGRYGSASLSTNTGGYVNLSAPSGSPVAFSIGDSEDYNGTAFNAPVPAGGVAVLTWPLTGTPGQVGLPHWGWLASQYVAYGTPPQYVGTILDSHNEQPLPLAVVGAASADITLPTGGSQPSNSLGEFLSDAPVGPADILSVSHVGYLTNTTKPWNVGVDATVAFSTVNLTGFGIVAGTVVGEPNLAAVPGATVTVCPGTNQFSSFCTTQITNATGQYWISADPGADTLRVTATGYVTNYSESVTVTTDSWQHVAPFVLVTDGEITGVIRQEPTGLTLAGATVSACSPLGTPTGPCAYTVASAANGSFSFPVVPSQYIIAASMLDFNTSYRTVAVEPGETVNVGAIFLTEFGIVSGLVISQATGFAIENASVAACPVDPTLPCAAPTVTSPFGLYRVAATPGAIAITVTAPGFENGYLTVEVRSGATVAAATIALIPVASTETRSVAGRVSPADNPTGGIAGAVLTFDVGTASAYSAVTDANGGFSTTVAEGLYSVVASAPGYASVTIQVTVNRTISGLVFLLPTFGWNVTFTVVDGLSQSPLAGALIDSGPTQLGVAGSSGQLSVSLPNGSYALTVDAPVAKAAFFVPVSFMLQIAGSSATRTVDLFPQIATLTGTVRATDGAPIVGATLTLSGTASEGSDLVVVATTDANGAYSLSAYAGTYTVTASASGYHDATQAVSLTGGPSSLPLTLSANSVVAPAGSNGPSPLLVGVIGAALVGAAAVALLVWGKSRGSKS